MTDSLDKKFMLRLGIMIILFAVGCILLFLAQVFIANTENLVIEVLWVMSFILAALGLGGILMELIHNIFYGQLERRERARFFLELISMAEKSGQSIEQTIIEFSRSGNRPLGKHFDQVARYIESGLNLSEALDKTPGCLPNQVVATLKVGHETGGVGAILPAARERLTEKEKYTTSQLGVFYVSVGFVIATTIMGVLMTYVIPKFKAIYADMLGDGEALPAFTLWVINTSDTFSHPFSSIPSSILASFILCYLLHRFIRFLGGSHIIDQILVPLYLAAGFIAFSLFLTILSMDFEPILFALIGSGGFIGLCFFVIATFWIFEKIGLLDWFRHLIPWHRKRLQRDYSYVLALLLDSGITEDRAIELAARGTSNFTVKRWATKAIAGLESGVGLKEAIKRMDNSKEFQWRLTNALQTDAKFVDALRGWHESLTARADRQYQTYITLMETSLLFILGLIVGSIVIGMFLPLIQMIEKLAW